MNLTTPFFYKLFLLILFCSFQFQSSAFPLSCNNFPESNSFKYHIVSLKIKFCDSLVKYESGWNFNLYNKNGDKHIPIDMRKNFATFKLLKGNYTLWVQGIEYDQTIEINGLQKDTITICKDHFIDKINNDPTLTVGEQLDIGDTLHFFYVAPGCVGPSSIDTIQLVKLKDSYLGIIKSWKKSAKQKIKTEKNFELSNFEFKLFSKIEKECRLFKLNSGSCSAGPIIYAFKLNNNIVAFNDESCSGNSYYLLRRKLIPE